MLSVLPQFTSSDYRFGIFCPLCCLFFLNLRLLITVLVSFVHCVVCSSSIYVFWLPFRYLLSIVLSVLPQFTSSDYRFGIFCPLCCLFFLNLRLLITVLGIFCPLCCLFFLNLRLLITVLVSFVHCVVCSSSIYVFWLPFWYLLSIVLSVLPQFTSSDYRFRYLLSIVLSVLPQFTSSDYRFGIFCPLCCLFFLNLRLLITV